MLIVLLEGRSTLLRELKKIRFPQNTGVRHVLVPILAVTEDRMSLPGAYFIEEIAPLVIWFVDWT